MRASPFLPLLGSLALLGAGCAFQPSAAPTTTSTSKTVESSAPSSTEASTTLATGYEIKHLGVKNVPGFSASSELRVIRSNERINGRLYDPVNKQELVSYGVSDTGTDFRLPFYDLQGNKLGDLNATETTPGVFVARYIDANGAATPLEIQNKETKPMFNVVSIHKTELLPGTTENPCEFEASYPQLTDALGLDPKMLAQINEEIASSSRPMTITDQPKVESLDQSAKDYLQACKDSAADMMADTSSSDESMGSPPAWYFSQTFDIPLVTDRVLSIMLATEEYSGGAHGSHFFSFINIDLKTGKRLKLGDLITTNQLKPFFQHEKSELLKQNEDNSMLFEEDAALMETFVKNRGPQTAAETKEFSNFDSFYLTHDGLTTMYNEYEVAPYAAGPQSVDLPYASIKQYFSSGSVLNTML